ncbi:HD domain-containing protein [Flavobacterium sp. RHBU_3]|uniref:HD domain-containing protein n=1 Tax=Flavobacterium sp. RHBU_3 TaxID=3391184 RepID=UPI003984F879
MNHPVIQKARAFAMASHGTQQYGNYPYEIHLGNVVTAMLHFGIKPDNNGHASLLAAAWLHDVLEDTPVTYDELQVAFTSEIAEMVFAVTDEPGANRKERKAKTYVKLAQNPDSVIVKLADRIANVEFSVVHGNASLLEMYRKEQPGFEAAIQPALISELHLEMLHYLNGLL